MDRYDGGTADRGDGESPRRQWTPEPSGQARLRPLTEATERATFLELFFDLVFVFALTRIAARAFEDLVLQGETSGWPAVTATGKTLLLLLALWSVWQGTAWMTSRYDPYHLWLQVVVITSLVTTMVMGVAIPLAYTSMGLAFAAAYVAAQVSRPLILMLALGRHPARGLELRMLVVYGATAVLWLTGAFLPTSVRVVLWLVALGAEYLVARLGWPVPGLGRSIVNRWQLGGAHLAERYQQFFLVALGETILVAGLTFSAHPFGADHSAAFATAVVTSILMWRIYIQRAGRILAEAVAKAAEPAAISRSATDTHLVMVLGLVATAIGYELAIGHPLVHPPVVWVAMVAGGPVLFLVGRARFEYEVFGRVSPSRWVAALVLLALVPALVRVPALLSSVTAAVVLLAVAVADARRAWGKPPEQAKPPF
ncbi:low temperature requirement protein A [Micromonospora sp. B11E3]|uniref:low temperature requirement protein A n=1 Tax=Micromonospora sp. B11E3 TaxID=3153562 RepID=UPI00325CAB75